MACSTTGTDRNIDIAFDRISDLLQEYSKEDVALSIEGYVTPLHVRGILLESCTA